jgi:hypothetical protein
MNSLTDYKVDWKDWKTYTLLLPVLFAYALYKPLEALRKRVWNDTGWFSGCIHEVLAIGAGWGAAVTAAAQHSLPHLSWLGNTGQGIVAGYITWAYIFPIIWLCGLHPAYRVVKWCYNHLDWVDKKVLGPLLQATAKLFGWLPGAASGWARMKDDNWFVALVGGLAYLTALGGSLSIGWFTKDWLTNAVHQGGFITHEFIVGGAWTVGILVAGLLSRLLLGAVQEGNKQGVGAVVSAASTYAAWHWGWLAAAASLTGMPAIALGAVSYVLLAVYGFPLLYLVVASGFWKRVWKKIEPAYDHFFETKRTAFAHLHLQSLAITASAAVAFAAFLLCSALGVNLLVATACPALAFLIAYVFLPEVADQDYGNVAVDAIVSIGLAVWAGFTYFHAGYIFGVWGAILTGLVSGIVSFFAYPLVYCGVEWLATLPVIGSLTNWLGDGLPKLHKNYIDHVVQPTVNKCETVYNWGYGHGEKDEKKAAKLQSFSRLTLHGANGLIAGALAVGSFVGVQHIALVAGVEPVASLLAAAIVALFSVGLVGRVIYRAGLELSGGLASAYVALKVGAAVVTVQQFGVWFAVPFALVVGSLTFVVGFPALLIPLRALTSWAAPALNVPLDWINNKAWSLIKSLVKGFGRLFDFVYDLFEPIFAWIGRVFAWVGRFFVWLAKVTAPLWMGIAGIIHAGWTLGRNIWKSIFG